MADGKSAEEREERRGYVVELAAAVLLGVGTMMGAYAAYQGSLWSGNCLTAYNQGTNKLGDANREMLRGVQEQSFDAVLWMENIKAQEAVVAKEEAEEKEAATAEVLAAVVGAAAVEGEGEGEGADGEDEGEGEDGEEVAAAPPASAAPVAEAAATAEDDEEGDPAQEIIDDLLYSADMPVAKQLEKLLNTRKNLGTALKWADTQYTKRMAALTDKQKLELAHKILAAEAEQEKVGEELEAALTKAGVEDTEDEDEIAAAVAKDPNLAKAVETAEARWFEIQGRIDAEYDRLSKPMFFESPDYRKTHERAYTQLLDEGNKLLQEGQLFNGHGDKFTLTTVLFTVTLFFAGMSTVLRRFPIKVAFLVISVGMLAYSTVQMFSVPFA